MNEAVARDRRVMWILRGAFLVSLVAFAFFTGRSVDAIPRYSAEYGQRCALCHVNPSGGGLRTSYASQFLVPTEMVANQFDMEELGGIDPQINEHITIGTDVRTIASYSSDDARRPQNNFFQMQGDLYLAFQGGEKFTIYLDRGQSTTYELFGMAQILPYTGYVKVGRFTPAYGWKLADHNAFTRERLGFLPPAHTDVGVEAGIFPGDMTIQAALLNGNQGSTLDTNDELSFAARAGQRWSRGDWGIFLGGSYQYDADRPSVVGDAMARNQAGPFGYLNYKRLTWLGEIDWVNRDLPDSDEAITEFIMSHEVTVHAMRGLDFVGGFSYMDPDVDLKTGTWSRWSGGVEWFVNPFLIVSGLVQSYQAEAGSAIAEEEYEQAVLQAHFLY